MRNKRVVTQINTVLKNSQILLILYGFQEGQHGDSVDRAVGSQQESYWIESLPGIFLGTVRMFTPYHAWISSVYSTFLIDQKNDC